ncbi:hypothetical protein BTVI_41587 [Pitangus sulphuratus]|nr:hypothetical protein BTVI_41587 [Pitangus sulphuratus]
MNNLYIGYGDGNYSNPQQQAQLPKAVLDQSGSDLNSLAIAYCFPNYFYKLGKNPNLVRFLSHSRNCDNLQEQSLYTLGPTSLCDGHSTSTLSGWNLDQGQKSVVFMQWDELGSILWKAKNRGDKAAADSLIAWRIVLLILQDQADSCQQNSTQDGELSSDIPVAQLLFLEQLSSLPQEGGAEVNWARSINYNRPFITYSYCLLQLDKIQFP